MREPKLYCVLLSLLILFLSGRTFPQNNFHQLRPPSFETLSVEDGLPENSVTCILQDYLGYMWFGTQNGLAKYDGYSMKEFKADTADNKSISGNKIVTLFEDSKKTLWIGTLNGLNRFDRKDESFKSFVCDLNDTNSISSDWIHSIYEDRSGRLWIGTLSGLNLFDRDKEIFTRFYFIDSDSKALNQIKPGQNSLAVNAITGDPLSGDLLLGTGVKGLWRFNINRKTLSPYELNDSSDIDPKTSWIQNFYRARDGRLWISSLNNLSALDPVSKELKCYYEFPIRAEERFTEPNYSGCSVIEDQYGNIAAGFFAEEYGLIYLNPNTREVNIFELIPNTTHNAMLNKIHSIYEDRSGIIWIGTWSTGVKKWVRYENDFSVLQGNASDPNSLSSAVIYSLVCDPKGYTWYCTPEGVDRYDQRSRRYTHYLQNEKCITDFMVYAAMIDHSGNLWLGTSTCGLVKFNTQNFSYHFYLNNPNKQNLIGKTVLYLIQDHLGYIWIGTRGFGLFQYNPENGSLVQYKNDPRDSLSLRQNEVLSILEDHNGDLWVGTNLGGVQKFIRDTGKFLYAGFQNCLSMFEDSRNRLWVSEYLSGLNLFDTEKLKVTANYSRDNGLTSNTIIGITEDDEGNLWFISDAGMSRVNPENKTVKNFSIENNLANVFNFFIPVCSGKGVDGRMYINTRKGLVIFNPSNVKEDSTPPQVVIRDLSLFNRPGEKLEHNGFIPAAEKITLPHDQNDLRFDYVGLQYNDPQKNTYKYILENFDEDWVEAGTQRNAVYTNLSPGTYIFRVKAANRDGIWSSDEASLQIIITPPWWKTSAAYVFYIVFIIGLVYLTWKLQLKRIRIRHEYEMSRFETEKLHEVDEIKSKFFANISHEFRTPLTLILGPAKTISDSTQEQKTKQNISLVRRNADRLLGLVNQLLDISKLESGKMKLETKRMNIVSLMKALTMSFSSYAERKRIELRFSSAEDEIMVYLDKNKFEKIIINLLSNAFKFTPDGGEIEIAVDCHAEPARHAELVSASHRNKIPKQVRDDNKNDFVLITISDTGIGIPEDRINKIFDRFYQVDGSHTREQEGTGIGLSLTKELVELHKGKIEVESQSGKGSTFTVSFPLGKDHLRPEEICETGEEEESEISFIEEEARLGPGKLGTDFILNDSLPLLLIVEDNPEVRGYIGDNLDTEYRILEAVDGEDGWNKSVEYMPDLIISDVMMPKMDGFRLCEKLKSDERTSHIPVILLTAKAAREDKLEGFGTGADEYLMKPFDTDELRSRIRNLIEQRKRLQDHFRKQGLIGIDEQKITSVDKQFLQKSIEIINKHLSDSTFNLDDLAGELAVSRSALQKKFNSLIGETPGGLIRRSRLDKAAELIKHKFGNLSEIALEVGYNNPAHFSESFKKQFGITPSQFQKNNNGG